MNDQFDGTVSSVPAFLAGGGEMGARMRAHDWSTSPLGNPSTWPQSLRTLVSVVLSARQPMFVAWGPELAFLYNDDYAPIFGSRHPDALGQPFAEVWSDIWPQIEPLVTQTLAGDASFHEDLLIPMQRGGELEDAWFTFSYTPACDDMGAVAGMICVATETTRQVLAERHVVAERERQRRLFEKAPGFITILRGPELTFEFANEAYARIFGGRDFVGKTVREVFPDLVGQPFFALLENTYATGERFVARHIPIRLVNTPGGLPEDRFLDFIYEPVRDEAGEVTGLFIEGYDVTERIAAESEQRAGEARLRALSDLSDRMRVAENAEDLPHAAAEILGRTLGVSRVGYGMIDAATDTLHVDRDWTGPGVASLAGVTPLRDYGTFIDSLKQDEFVTIADVRKDERTAVAASALEERSARSFVNVPVVEHGRLVAVLFVNHAEARNWRVEELALIREFAERTRTAVQRHRNETALRESEARFRNMADSSPVMMWVTDPVGHCTYLNRQWYDYTGQSEAEGEGYGWLDATHPEDREAAGRGFVEANAKREGFRVEYRLRRADGAYRWAIDAAAPRFDADGRYLGYVGSVIDIDERRESEEHLRLMVNELNHRVKNSLATVQAIAAQTFRDPDRFEQSKKDFSARLISLAAAHDVLTETNWTGASMRQVADRTVGPHLGDAGERFTLDGPDVVLVPKAALALSMALHELCTNAAKYGALSVTDGHVQVVWRVDCASGERRLLLTWIERGGPPVVPPTRKGFGSRLVEYGLAAELGGEVRIEYPTTGVVCTVDAPLPPT